MEPGNKDCQLKPELCEELPLVVSPPPMCMGASSELLLDEALRAWDDDSVDPLELCGILKASPLVEEESRLALRSPE
jgi:hypothetical protein